MKLVKSLIVFILITLLTPGVTLSRDNEQVLQEALNAAGAEPDMIDIVDWSVINREFLEFAQMENCRDKIIDIFEIGEKTFDIIKENSESYRILNTRVQLDSETFLHIILQSVRLPEEYEKEPQTYLVVNVSGRKFDNFVYYGKKVQEAVLSLGGESKITSCVTGYFNGKLDEAEQDQILENIYDCLKISHKQIMKDEYTFSLMGYSPLFVDCIEIMDKCYNVNIAIRYNLEDDKTYIWIGIPVISIEY
ncbi:MAG: YwmB family TATA-box binding protein [Tepidanaerobacteraceae bacterium]|jgi:hypothetical protein|nr:YwmB family TATA-box binding protein [Tepidanaerobacter sp.]HQA59733.1 YwmB family TATA-box binding protein [Tepidanaerobacteraceae bacterium]HQE06003.1 YwmB family TATA-box binding protein [Tepidanaerobacteraceae bacterium]